MKGFGEIDKSKKRKKSNFIHKYDENQLINDAIQYHCEGNILQASELYKFLIGKGSKNSTAYTNYGLILINSDKKKEAEILIKKAIELNPKDSAAYSNLGGILQDQGKLQEAEIYTRKAIELNPKDSAAYSNLGGILQDQGKLQEAEIYTRKAIELNPYSAEAHSNLGGILNDFEKLKEAEIYIRKAIELNPKFANAYSNLGSIARKLDKLQEAEFYTRKAIELNPNFAEAYSNLGGILRELDKLKEAEMYTRKAIELNPTFANAYSNLGIILYELGILKEAEMYTLKAIKVNPNFAKAYYSLSKIEQLTSKKNWEEYLFTNDILDKQKDIDKIDIYFARANILERQSKYTQSANMLKEANTLNRKLYGSNYIQTINQLEYYDKIWQKLKINHNQYKNQLESIFIIGLPRSGKTITESILSVNEDLLKCGEDKALSISIDKYLKQKGTFNKQDLYQIYMENISKKISHKSYICTTTPINYLFTGIIASQIPKSKVIYCFRNPLDHIKELYSHNINNKYTFRTSIIESANILLSINELMENYKNIFNSKIFFLNYDKLVLNPKKEIQSLLSWLGWEYKKDYLHPQLDQTTMNGVGNLNEVINTKHLNVWKNYEELLQPAIEIISNNKNKHLFL